MKSIKCGAEWAGVCYAAKDAVTFLAAFVLMFGPLVKNYLGGNLIHAVMAGGVFVAIAAVLVQFVKVEPAGKKSA